jgi:electron transfer flavoprotein beta subunit
MKQVPQKDAPLKLNESSTWIREDVSYEVNEPDAFALEEALRQKEKHGGEVVVITAGPARAQQVLREALAKGADRAIHLEDNAFVGLDASNTARAFAAAIKDEKFDLIFTGLQSDDYGFARWIASYSASSQAATSRSVQPPSKPFRRPAWGHRLPHS